MVDFDVPISCTMPSVLLYNTKPDASFTSITTALSSVSLMRDRMYSRIFGFAAYVAVRYSPFAYRRGGLFWLTNGAVRRALILRMSASGRGTPLCASAVNTMYGMPR